MQSPLLFNQVPGAVAWLRLTVRRGNALVLFGLAWTADNIGPMADRGWRGRPREDWIDLVQSPIGSHKTLLNRR